MKMLFFSSDAAEVADVGREFTGAGIGCEVRHPAFQPAGIPSQAELWVMNDRDCHRALMLCVQRNIGFARRPLAPVDDEEYACAGAW